MIVIKIDEPFRLERFLIMIARGGFLYPLFLPVALCPAHHPPRRGISLEGNHEKEFMTRHTCGT
jgi:hypothetical protein